MLLGILTFIPLQTELSALHKIESTTKPLKNRKKDGNNSVPERILSSIFNQKCFKPILSYICLSIKNLRWNENNPNPTFICLMEKGFLEENYIR